jgi:UDP-N-acetylglucosamine 4-epimerase
MESYTRAKEQMAVNPKKWLVTGAAGFIGSNIVEALLTLGQQVVGLDNFLTGHPHNLDDVLANVQRPHLFTFIEGDIRDLRTCREACEDVDAVLHQAALGSVPRSINDPLTTHLINADGTLHMLLAARDANVDRFVFASSSSVYGDHPGLPKVEDVVGVPLSPYAVAKQASENYARTFYQHYGLETIGLRYFNVFGKRQDPNGAYAAVIPKWISGIYHGESCHINGDGKTSRDFCHVSNVVAANVLAAVAPSGAAGQVFNIACGEQMTLDELFCVIREELKTYRPEVAEIRASYCDFRSGDIHHSLADTSKACKLLDYVPITKAREGLAETVRWYVRDLQRAVAG